MCIISRSNNMQQHPLTLFFWQPIAASRCRAPSFFGGSVIITYAQTAKYSRWAICNQSSSSSSRGVVWFNGRNSLTYTARLYTFREFSVCFVSCVCCLFPGRRKRETGKIHRGKNKQTMCLRWSIDQIEGCVKYTHTHTHYTAIYTHTHRVYYRTRFTNW